MTAKAGDTVFSLESITVDAAGVCRAQLSVGIVDKNDARHPVRRQSVVVSLSNDQKAQFDVLRSAISTQLALAPPSGLADAVPVSAQPIADRMEARRAQHFADRDARHNVPQLDPGPRPTPGPAPDRGRRP